MRDFYQPYLNRQPKQLGVDTAGAPILVARAVMALLSAIALLVCLGKPPFIWSLVAITISFFIQLSPMFILGLYWNRSSRIGAITSWVVGVGLTFLWTFVLPAPFGVFPGMTALIINAFLFIVVSLLFPGTESEQAARREVASTC